MTPIENFNVLYFACKAELSHDDFIVYEALLEIDFIGPFAESTFGRDVIEKVVAIRERLKEEGKLDKDFIG